MYDEQFHQDDQIRKCNFSDTFTIPEPDICHVLWRILNERIEHREPDEEAKFIVKWGDWAYNSVELTTIKDLGYELQRTKKDTENKEQHFLVFLCYNELTPG